jgi:methenyltetrahydromethanopterin cyclohydrolase
MSVNKYALQILKEVVGRKDELRVEVEKRPKGATIIDAASLLREDIRLA